MHTCVVCALGTQWIEVAIQGNGLVYEFDKHTHSTVSLLRVVLIVIELVCLLFFVASQLNGSHGECTMDDDMNVDAALGQLKGVGDGAIAPRVGGREKKEAGNKVYQRKTDNRPRDDKANAERRLAGKDRKEPVKQVNEAEAEADKSTPWEEEMFLVYDRENPIGYDGTEVCDYNQVHGMFVGRVTGAAYKSVAKGELRIAIRQGPGYVVEKKRTGQTGDIEHKGTAVIARSAIEKQYVPYLEYLDSVPVKGYLLPTFAVTALRKAFNGNIDSFQVKSVLAHATKYLYPVGLSLREVEGVIDYFLLCSAAKTCFQKSSKIARLTSGVPMARGERDIVVGIEEHANVERKRVYWREEAVECRIPNTYKSRLTFNSTCSQGAHFARQYVTNDVDGVKTLEVIEYPSFDTTADFARKYLTNMCRFRGDGVAPFIMYDNSATNCGLAAKRMFGARDFEEETFMQQFLPLSIVADMADERFCRFHDEAKLAVDCFPTLRVKTKPVMVRKGDRHMLHRPKKPRFFPSPEQKARYDQGAREYDADYLQSPLLSINDLDLSLIPRSHYRDADQITRQFFIGSPGEGADGIAAGLEVRDACQLVDKAFREKVRLAVDGLIPCEERFGRVVPSVLATDPEVRISVAKFAVREVLQVIARAGTDCIDGYINRKTDGLKTDCHWLYYEGYRRFLTCMEPILSRQFNANIPHVKRALRQAYVNGVLLHEDEDCMVRRMNACVKMEFAKTGKVPRLFVTYGAGCMYANELPEYAKIMLDGDEEALSGMCVDMTAGPRAGTCGNLTYTMHVMAKPSSTRLTEMLRAAIDAMKVDNHVCVLVYSDDTVYTGRINGVDFATNVDIASCDASQGPLVFSLTGALLSKFHPGRAQKLLEQCTRPLMIENPNDRAEQIRIDFYSAFEGSGTVLTTILNHIASMLIGYSAIGFLAKMVDMYGPGIDPSKSRALREDVGNMIQLGAFSVGHHVTVEHCGGLDSPIIEKIQFLKRSPLLCSDGSYHAVLNYGCLLRSFGSVMGDLTSEQIGVGVEEFRNMTWQEKMDTFLAGVVRGLVNEPASALLDALRERFLSGTHLNGYLGGAVVTDPSRNLELSWSDAKIGDLRIDPGSLSARYEITSDDLNELCSHIKQLLIGDESTTKAAAQFYRMDYGVSVIE